MVNLFFDEAWLPGGWQTDVLVEVDGRGMIAAVTAGADGAKAGPGGICIPGLANLHSHAFQRAMAGLTERAGPGRGSFWTWRKVMYDFAARVGPDDLEAIAGQLYVEMLEAGYTAVGEFHYLHHAPDGRAYADVAEMSKRIIRAASETGIGLTLLPVLYAHDGFGGQAPGAGQIRFVCDADGFAGLLAALAPALGENMRLGIAPHSLRAVDPGLLQNAIIAIRGRDAAAPIHIHIAEQDAEVDECLAWCGARPVEWLLANQPVDRHWCLVHATHMTADETRALAASGAVAGLCPTTEANLGDGLFPLPLYLDNSGAFGIGSDSHISVNAAEELRLLEYGQRLNSRARNIGAGGEGRSTGAALLTAALRGGARALNRPAGAIAPGHLADLVVLDSDSPALTGRRGDDILDTWIFFNGGTNPVRHVYVAGRQVVEQGRHPRRQETAARFAATMKRLLD
jgi:formimidoylglutamate deiminase